MGKTSERILILGLDGATWTVLDAMRERGLMPNLDALVRRSAHGTLRSSVPPMTAAAWATMQTGCGPARHGIFDHRYHDVASGRMKINHAGRIRVPTTWQLLSRTGRSVVSLNLPGTFPAPAGVRGVIVGGMDAPHLEAATASCPEFAERLRHEAPRYSLRYHWKRAPQSLDELTENARKTVESFLGRAQGGVAADRFVPDWSALMVQFQNLDPFQHRVWRYLNVDETGIDHPSWNEAAGSVLKGLDDAIGMLLEVADRRGADVLVVSDHGFGPCLGRIHVNRILIQAGIAAMPSLAGRFERRVRQGFEHLRLWSEKRDDPNARSASFEQLVAAQFPFDWSRTRAFAPHQDTAAMVYLNRSGRFGGTSSDQDRTLDEVAGALAEARHPETGIALFPTIVKLAEAHGVDPAAEGYPDLLALPDEAYWVRTKLGRGTSWVEADPNLPGTHRPEGIVAFRGQGVTPGRTLKAELQDVAPTILARFGIPVPAHMEGKPLPCIPKPAEDRRDPGAATLHGLHQPRFEYTAEEEAIIEQRLADLGYLE